jgi:transglycosylase-like protein
LPDVAGRRRAVPAALLVAALLASIIPSVATATAPPGLERFLYALGQVESGGSYTALNETSGAYGKYQIIPASWAAWAKLYLGSSTAPQTPTNQEIVAHRKVTALYGWLDTWPVVAHWWLTGSSERNANLWSSYSRSYVQKIMAIYYNTSDVTGTRIVSTTSWIDSSDPRIGETSTAIAYASTWSTASYAAYSGGRVKYATRTGASATLTFTGNGVAWIGPVGPTRGTARVYIDGKAVATVDLRRSTFQARKILFSRALTAGNHTLRIVVTSSSRPVAIDNFVVGK